MRNTRHMLTVVIVLALISFMSLSFSVSYSYMTQSKIGGNAAQLTTTNMNYTATFTNQVGQGMYFLSDEDGMNQTSYSTVNITKPTGYSTYYYIYFCYSSNSASADNLPMEYVRYAIYTVDGSGNLSASPVAGPAPIADLANSGSSQTFQKAYYVAYLGTLTSSVTSKKLAIKVWADPAAEANYSGSPTNVAAIVYQYPLLNTVFNNISGILYDSSGTIGVRNATISLNHGMITTTTTADGAEYTLSNVPMGTWTLDVITEGVTYSTVINVAIQTSSYPAGSVQAYPATTSSNNSGTWLQTRAYARYTTVYKILNYPSNTLTNDSNHKASGSYTTPAAYRIYGADSFETNSIENIEIRLATNNQLLVQQMT